MSKWRLDRGQIEVVDEAVAAVLRRMTPAQRVALIGDAHDTARLMLQAAIKLQHPEWDEDAVNREVVGSLLRQDP